jgi:hypothetical protein
VVVCGSFLAWRNLRLGRGDRQGALRLAGFTFVIAMLSWALRTHGVTSADFSMWIHAFGEALWSGAQLWLAYVALEPFVRRRWPRILVSWTRIVAGRWRDPLVGRDILIGTLGGLAYVLSFTISSYLQFRQGSTPATNLTLETLLGIRPALSSAGYHLLDSLTGALLLFMFFFLLRLVLRKEWLAGIVMTLIFALGRGYGDPHAMIVIPAYLFIYGMIVPILLRFGLLSLIVNIFVTDTILSLAFTTNFSAWYGSGSLVMVLILGGLAILSFRSALGGQKVLAGLLEQ